MSIIDDQLRDVEAAIVDGPVPVLDPQELAFFLDEHPGIQETLPRCWGNGCTEEKRCGNCQAGRRWLALQIHRSRHGRAMHPSEAVDGKPNDARGKDEWPEDQRGDAWEEPPADYVPSETAPDDRPMQPAKGKEKKGLCTFAWDAIDSPTFFTLDLRPQWLILHVLARRQPVIFAGPRKSLKTTLLIAMVIALASGEPFLGHFRTYGPVRVAILSGESGSYTVQETARRICEQMGIDANTLPVLWGFTLPQLGNPADMAVLKAALALHKIEVLIIDPLYLCLLAGLDGGQVEASNLFQMGPLLASVAKTCIDANCTPILAAHARKNLTNAHEPMQLEDIAWAGIQEFARQWVLVNRRASYEPGSGVHQLWMQAGGSAGHSGCWGVNIDEGQLNEHFGGRRWELSISTAEKVREGTQEAGADAKEQRQHQQNKADETAVLLALDKTDPDKKGAGYAKVQAVASLSDRRMAAALVRLVADGIVKEGKVKVGIGKGGKRKARGLRRIVQEDHTPEVES